VEPIAQRGHFSAKLARKAYEVHENGSWKQGGFKGFVDWATEDLHFQRRSVYKYLKIIKYLGCLSDQEIDRLGPERCYLYARRFAKKGLNPGMIGEANDATVEELRAIMNAELRKTGDKAVFGENLDPSFRGLEHAPINEQGVVFLFGMVSRELGFRVLGISQRYPDCIAKQRISDRQGKGQWREVRIEFEYTSEKFYKHGHSPEHTDIIVCWEDNLSVKPEGCPRVLELKSEIEKLRKIPVTSDVK
jgi:hypothetical protein